MKGFKDESFLTLVGQFVGYEIQDGYQIKRLQLLTPSGIQSIKLSKEAKASLFQITLDTRLQPGMTLSLQVTQKQKDAEVKLKAYGVELLSSDRVNAIAPFNSPDSHPPQTEILVCDRGTCHKRRADQVYQALCLEVTKRELTDQVVVKRTGCLKACKYGVNVKINQMCHSQVSPAQAASLIEQHSISRSCMT